MNKKAGSQKDQWAWYQAKYEMAEFIINRLENYKLNYNNEGHSLPVWVLEDSEKNDSYSDKEIIELNNIWNQELDEIISAFKQILNYTLQFDETLEYNEEKIQVGLNKFSKYYLHFWD